MTEITELVELNPERVDGVLSPANGTPWLLVKSKAQADSDTSDTDTKQCPTCDGEGKIMQGNRQCPDCDGKGKVPASFTKSDSSEADDMQETVTGSAAKATVYCGDPDCDECVKAELVPLTVRTTVASGVTKAQLKAADRKKMPASSFAYVDPKGGKHLPVHDEAHARAAVSRFGQQDFSDADDPAKAKAKAAGKIKAAAGKFGIDVDDDSDVAQAAKKSEDEAQKGEVQDALAGTKTPEVAGHLDGSQSGVAGPVTGDVQHAPDPVLSEGGKTPYTVPAEQRLADSGPAAGVHSPARPPSFSEEAATVTKDEDGLTVKAMAVASLVDAMAQVEEQRRAAKQGNYLSALGPTADQAAAPGSMPWESYDSATLDQVASCLAACCNAIDAIATREQIEALNGDAGDQSDAWDLQDASSALEYAMGVVARLAYSEGAEAQKSEADPHYQAVEKAYRRLRASDEKALRDTHSAITNVLAAHDRATGTAEDAGQDDSSEGDKIQMELTKSELAEAIVAGAQEVLKAQREQDEQAAKAQRKADKKARKQAEAEAKKNANNNGDITAQQLKDGVGSEQDADDVGCVQGAVDSKYVNKSEGETQGESGETDTVLKAMQDQLKAATEQLGQLGEQVQKIAKRPRQGGPVLDGQARGAFPAAEARMSEVTKADGDELDQAVKSAEEQFEEAKKSGDPTAISNASVDLTKARLVRAHQRGEI